MTELWVERTGTRRYTGHSSRGAQVLVGSEDVDGVFTPGELMKIALAACSGMSSDQPLAHRLGDDYQAVVRVSGDADRDNEVYPLLSETLELTCRDCPSRPGAAAGGRQPGDRPGLHRRAHAESGHHGQVRHRPRSRPCRALTCG